MGITCRKNLSTRYHLRFTKYYVLFEDSRVRDLTRKIVSTVEVSEFQYKV